MKYLSQCKQDEFVDGFFRQKKGGTFAEIGAFDGVCLSNTGFLEAERGWTGVCVEANPEQYRRLVENRKCRCVHAAAGAANADAVDFVAVSGGIAGLSALASVMNIPRLEWFMKRYKGSPQTIRVPMRRTQDIFDEAGLSVIDYLSIDTDGNELDVLHGIDFGKTKIKLMTVEDIEESEVLQQFLFDVGFGAVCRLQWDSVYINQNL